MAHLFVAVEDTGTTRRYFYISASGVEMARILAKDVAEKHGITWSSLTFLPGLLPETLKLSAGEIKEWPEGELLNSSTLSDPL
jgi:hypothetical protein